MKKISSKHKLSKKAVLGLFLVPFAALATFGLYRPLFSKAETLPTAGRIAMTSGRDGNLEIYSVYNDGTDLKRLTNNNAVDDQATWEPGQARLAFASERTNGRNLWVMNADGSNQVMLTSSGSVKRPVWSPDGSVIAFIGKGGIYSIKPDGTDLHMVLANSVFGEGPGHLAWSPDMQWFLVTLASKTGNQDIFKIRVNGTELTQLTTDSGIDRHATWSPDGTRIAWDAKPQGAKKYSIFSMNPDGTDKKALTNGKESSVQPTWSLDSQYLAFHSGSSISKILRDGGTPLKITTGPKDESPEWAD